MEEKYVSLRCTTKYVKVINAVNEKVQKHLISVELSRKVKKFFFSLYFFPTRGMTLQKTLHNNKFVFFKYSMI